VPAKSGEVRAARCGTGVAIALCGWCGPVASQPIAVPQAPATWTSCRSIDDDRDRLACYDAAAAHASNAASVASHSLSSGPQPVASAEQLKALALDPAREPGRWRLAFSFGYGVGDYAGSFKIFGSGLVRSESALGSAGDTFIAEGWYDRWPGDDWSVGLSYIRFKNRGRAQAILPKGISVLTDPVFLSEEVDARAQLGFAEIAYRPQTTSPLRPFIGAGLGGGYGHATLSTDLSNAFIGPHPGSGRAASPIPALEAFMGADIPVLPHLYFTFGPRVVWATGHPFGLDQRYLNIILSAGLGLGS
jgi:hypothetical protein